MILRPGADLLNLLDIFVKSMHAKNLFDLRCRYGYHTRNLEVAALPELDPIPSFVRFITKPKLKGTWTNRKLGGHVQGLPEGAAVVP